MARVNSPRDGAPATSPVTMPATAPSPPARWCAVTPTVHFSAAVTFFQSASSSFSSVVTASRALLSNCLANASVFAPIAVLPVPWACTHPGLGFYPYVDRAGPKSTPQGAAPPSRGSGHLAGLDAPDAAKDPRSTERYHGGHGRQCRAHGWRVSGTVRLSAAGGRRDLQPHGLLVLSLGQEHGLRVAPAHRVRRRRPADRLGHLPAAHAPLDRWPQPDAGQRVPGGVLLARGQLGLAADRQHCGDLLARPVLCHRHPGRRHVVVAVAPES